MAEARAISFRPQVWRDRALHAAIIGGALTVALTLGWLVGGLLWHGLGKLSLSFLLDAPVSSGRRGGIGPIIVSTLWIVAVAIFVALPVGITTAVLLVEYAPPGSRAAAAVSLALDVLAGMPSIVFGLFGNALFSIWLGLGFSILSGGLTLACMVLPILIRTTEAGLRDVPPDWRMGAAALGLSRLAALWQILLPAAASAIIAGLMLGIGRALAESAALIFTSGYVDRMPGSLLDSGRSLAVHIFDLTMNVPGGEQSAYASALVLVGLLIVINGAVLFATHRLLRRRIVLA
jgi:phosphate transport system permease protein